MLKPLFGDGRIRQVAEALYGRAVEQARDPEFYRSCGVPDTVDGRFDMIAIHVFLLLRRLKRAGDTPGPLAQALFDTMFDDMDRLLREMGAGDLGVGRRVKNMAQAFSGRIAAYESGLDGADGILEAAVLRNVFRGGGAPHEAAAALARYIRHQTATLGRQPLEEIAAGRVAFTDAAVGLNGEPPQQV